MVRIAMTREQYTTYWDTNQQKYLVRAGGKLVSLLPENLVIILAKRAGTNNIWTFKQCNYTTLQQLVPHLQDASRDDVVILQTVCSDVMAVQ